MLETEFHFTVVASNGEDRVGLGTDGGFYDPAAMWAVKEERRLRARAWYLAKRRYKVRSGWATRKIGKFNV